ncbi:histone-lysine N-methyltransferase family member SUVH9-like [Curcuma longa]|uniref:histone-lysine N-methyltransferase family member SUVH9-like n=1 Tax=Curcuma longa TaxID=136217 RepID=UPI003D9E2532
MPSSSASPPPPPWLQPPFLLPGFKPELEPKIEPMNCPSGQLEPFVTRDTLLFTPPNPNTVPDEVENAFPEHLRLAHHLGASSNDHRSVISAPVVEVPAGPSDIVGSRKRKARSAEMVRASIVDTPDRLYFRGLVRRTRMTYDSLRYLLLTDDHGRGEAGLSDEITRRRKARSDLTAGALMGNRDLWLNRDSRIIGCIPGIRVGDVFFYRMELVVIGLHGLIQAGIDFVTAGRSTSGEPIATSIVVSGGYEDDDDKGAVLIYTGQGGRERNVAQQRSDQKLHGGNLALERSMNYGIEIRVIRGIKCNKSPSGMVYFYDGLYKITDCWMDLGKSGFKVYKYKLLRIKDQDEMGSEMFKLANELKQNPSGGRSVGHICLDISTGKENVPVSLFNDVDNDKDPLCFEYIAHSIFPQQTSQGAGSMGNGCDCTMNCSMGCYCALKNGGCFPYDENGTLLRGKPLIYECGTGCKCPLTCPNRVSQKGISYELEVFRSIETGWGVRSFDVIRAGTFVCEFSGITVTKQEAEQLSDDGCLVYPGKFPARWIEWGDISDASPDYVPAGFPSTPDLSFSIDVSRARNVGCYLSHCRSPNVFAQFVLFDHMPYPRVMIFAMENIPPLRELSIDYGVGDGYA